MRGSVVILGVGRVGRSHYSHPVFATPLHL